MSTVEIMIRFYLTQRNEIMCKKYPEQGAHW